MRPMVVELYFVHQYVIDFLVMGGGRYSGGSCTLYLIDLLRPS